MKPRGPDNGSVEVALAEVGGGRGALLEAVVEHEHADGDGEQTREHEEQVPEAEPEYTCTYEPR